MNTSSSPGNDRPRLVAPAIGLILLAAAAAAYVLWPADDHPKSDPDRGKPPPAVSAVPSSAAPDPAAAVPEAAEPEEGSSARRIAWADVALEPPPAPMAQLEKAGEAIYAQHCLVCHGKDGKGDGPAAAQREPRPRNFTRGMYKFKTSIPDEMPFDDDLFRTVTSGIPAASMPSFGDLTAFERWALVAYTKKLTKFTLDDGRVIDHFGRSPAKTKMGFPAAPDRSKIDLARGQELFRNTVQCMKCHGEGGKGDGPAAAELVDVFDRPIAVPDMTRGEVSFKAGSKVEDIYRVLTSGMASTPMPSFTTVSEEDRWNLAYYVTSLYRPIPPGERVYLKVGCTSCHTIGKGKFIGPDLAGTMQRRKPEWLRKWLKDPPTLIATDADARKLYEEYLTPMPSYGLTDKEINHLLDFLGTLPPAPKPETSEVPR